MSAWTRVCEGRISTKKKECRMVADVDARPWMELRAADDAGSWFAAIG